MPSAFVYLVHVLISPFILKDNFAKYRIFSKKFIFLSAFKIYYPIIFWTTRFLLRDLLTGLWGNPLYMVWQVTFLFLLLRISVILFWLFDYNMPLCGSSKVLGVYWASWICISMYFLKFGKVLAIISSNNLSVPFALLLLGLPYCWV